MVVAHNVFAHSTIWAVGGGVFTPGALMQNETGLHESDNTYGLNTLNNLRSCDFDGDGAKDPFIATGVTWWYASARWADAGCS